MLFKKENKETKNFENHEGRNPNQDFDTSISCIKMN